MKEVAPLAAVNALVDGALLNAVDLYMNRFKVDRPNL